jgi:hypothetical protein
MILDLSNLPGGVDNKHRGGQTATVGSHMCITRSSEPALGAVTLIVTRANAIGVTYESRSFRHRRPQ